MRRFDRCLVLAMLCALVRLCTASGERGLQISPRTVHTQPGENATVSCDFKKLFAACEFRVRYQHLNKIETDDSVVFNVASRQGLANTTVIASGTGQELYKVTTWNSTTTCNVQLSDLYEGRYLVGCRVRSGSGDWEEKYMTLYIHEKFGTTENKVVGNHTFYEMIQVVKAENTSATIDLDWKSSEDYRFNGNCSLEGSHNVKQRDEPILNENKTRCSIPIVADETARGVVWATGPYTNLNKTGTNQTWYFKKIIVVEKPPRAILAVSFSEGESMTATCSAGESKHGADFVWSFENETLRPCRADGWTVTTINNSQAWSWPWETKTIEQTVSRRLDARNNGQILKCTVRFFDRNGAILKKEEESAKVTTGTSGETKVTAGTNKESSLLTWLLASLCFNLALAIAAFLVYAKLSKKFCFRQKAGGVQLRQLAALNRNVESERISENPAYEESRLQIEPTLEGAEYEDLVPSEPQYEEIVAVDCDKCA